MQKYKILIDMSAFMYMCRVTPSYFTTTVCIIINNNKYLPREQNQLEVLQILFHFKCK